MAVQYLPALNRETHGANETQMARMLGIDLYEGGYVEERSLKDAWSMARTRLMLSLQLYHARRMQHGRFSNLGTASLGMCALTLPDVYGPDPPNQAKITTTYSQLKGGRKKLYVRQVGLWIHDDICSWSNSRMIACQRHSAKRCFVTSASVS
ncbi:hypothetical protein BV25DRAFT_980670 [Artomyces pyxidatus]|uniref:Uncharacterized protein n=1 Tax=Artomyces pyxidatus TaxID=48021 RepID=A0ACB8SWN7_9AGAM|nr:hypothetical protein BV25DRAFT_980670 [Artomyces pyxidatus]